MFRCGVRGPALPGLPLHLHIRVVPDQGIRGQDAHPHDLCGGDDDAIAGIVVQGREGRRFLRASPIYRDVEYAVGRQCLVDPLLRHQGQDDSSLFVFDADLKGGDGRQIEASGAFLDEPSSARRQLCLIRDEPQKLWKQQAVGLWIRSGEIGPLEGCGPIGS